MFRLLVFEFKVMTIDYFMDECTEWELNDIIENVPYTDRNLWETTRLSSYINAKAHFKNIKNPQDICKFGWETEVKDKEIEISNDDINRLKMIAKQWEKD